MGDASRDFVLLNRVLKILDREKEAASFKVEELHVLLFERVSTDSGTWLLSNCREWSMIEISRGLDFVKGIVTLYVQLLQDPRAIPVTHYKRQKRIAIHLDAQFSCILREAAARSGALAWMNEEELRAHDAFLDEPILFLKQEARKKGFPRAKKGGGASLSALRERYESKLSDRGVKPLAAQDRWVQPGP
jgi:hypothetical protein